MNSNKPLVSVIIPTYKRPDMIARTIQSIKQQTYGSIEIIIVDDNGLGTDMQLKTAEVVAPFVSDIIYLVHEANKGGSAARNTGWKAAKGQYITFVDDDDELARGKIEKQVACLEKLDQSWGCCYTGYRLIKEHGDSQISSENRSGDCYVDALMKTMFMGSGSNLFLRKFVVDEINGYDESFIRNQDVEFLVRVLEKYKIAFIDEVLLTIYQEGNRTKRTLEKIEEVNVHYLRKFENRINSLEEADKERVLAVITLERFRLYLYNKRLSEGVKLLKDNRVKLKYIARYIKYLLNRIVTHNSYGFSGE